MESVWSVSKLSTESVGSRRELVANCVHTDDADATHLDSFVASASAVCIGYKIRYLHQLLIWQSQSGRYWATEINFGAKNDCRQVKMAA